MFQVNSIDRYLSLFFLSREESVLPGRAYNFFSVMEISYFFAALIRIL